MAPKGLAITATVKASTAEVNPANTPMPVRPAMVVTACMVRIATVTPSMAMGTSLTAPRKPTTPAVRVGSTGISRSSAGAIFSMASNFQAFMDACIFIQDCSRWRAASAWRSVIRPWRLPFSANCSSSGIILEPVLPNSSWASAVRAAPDSMASKRLATSISTDSVSRNRPLPSSTLTPSFSNEDWA